MKIEKVLKILENISKETKQAEKKEALEIAINTIEKYRWGIYSILETYIHDISYEQKDLVNDLDKLLYNNKEAN